MQTSHSSALGRTGRRYISGLLIVSALFILWIGIPRLLAELMLVPGQPILRKISNGGQVSEEDLATLEQSRLSAIRFADLPQLHADLGAAYLVRAQKPADTQGRLKYAEMSIAESNISLSMAPLNPFAWYRIAVAEMMFGPTHYDNAVKAWRSSIALASFEPLLLMQRIHIGTILYPHLNREDRVLLKSQIEMAFHWHRWKLKQYAREHNLTMWIVLLSGPDSDITAFMKKR